MISVIGAPDAKVELELSGALLEGFSIETLQPEPVRHQCRPGDEAVAADGRSGPGQPLSDLAR
jgi:hypothetical protein